MTPPEHTFGSHASALDTWERWQKLVQPIIDAACELVEHDPVYRDRWFREDGGPHARLKTAVETYREDAS